MYRTSHISPETSKGFAYATCIKPSTGQRAGHDTACHVGSVDPGHRQAFYMTESPIRRTEVTHVQPGLSAQMH